MIESLLFFFNESNFFYEKYFFIFLFGIIIGSFSNVLIYRLPIKNKSLLLSSSCPNCNKKIKPCFNIPLIGYFLTLGKCYNCKTLISVRYPLIELLFGLLFLIIFYFTKISILFLILITFSIFLITFFFIIYDKKK